MLGVVGAKTGEMVVVVIDPPQDGVGRLRVERGGCQAEGERNGCMKANVGILPLRYAQSQNDGFLLGDCYWTGWVQLVAPAGSKRMTLFSSMQNPRSPDFPTDVGTAVISKELY